jgi:hypothetical protein
MVAPTKDVSAVVLSLGEPTTDSAIESLSHQTVRPREVIIVRSVRPFHAALNAGAAKVKTSFFIQVDADMILDPGCIASLLEAGRRDTGIAIGYLRDALTREAVGVKLFRTECFQIAKVRDCISPDTEFGRDIAARGWKTVWVGRPKMKWNRPHTLGEHRPSYTPHFTYTKHLILGRRYRFRRDWGGIRWHFCRLETSPHPSAIIAQIALARGIFLESENDLTGVARIDPELDALLAFLESREGHPRSEVPKMPLGNTAQVLFAASCRAGSALFQAGDFSACAQLFGTLRTACSDGAWITKVGLSRGLCAASPTDTMIAQDYEILRDFLEGISVSVRLGLMMQQLLAHRRCNSLPA